MVLAPWEMLHIFFGEGCMGCLVCLILVILIPGMFLYGMLGHETFWKIIKYGGMIIAVPVGILVCISMIYVLKEDPQAFFEDIGCVGLIPVSLIFLGTISLMLHLIYLLIKSLSNL